MKDTETARFKTILKARRVELAALSQNSAAARRPVELDQQSVGRLTRQDALQQQAMAKAQEVRRVNEQHKIDAALIRIDADDYGWCEECGEAIVVRRLEIDPTALRCAACAGAISG
ncbi:MAG: TraR/DksA family transcriptional regulator [Alphaproteobacteria bacterium]|nr:TraR/DksA family transcriptional regulator [Alphaproteobacteria bacterium]